MLPTRSTKYVATSLRCAKGDDDDDDDDDYYYYYYYYFNDRSLRKFMALANKTNTFLTLNPNAINQTVTKLHHTIIMFQFPALQTHRAVTPSSKCVRTQPNREPAQSKLQDHVHQCL